MPRIRRSTPVAIAAAAMLVLSATACGPESTAAGSEPGSPAPASSGTVRSVPSGGPTGSALDVARWRQGDWRKWDHWARAAADFVNPVIEDLWDPARMSQAREDLDDVSASAGRGQGGTDPAPAPHPAQAVSTPYHDNAAPVGRVFFDTPQGPMVCSGTVVQDPAHPGKSDLVWTAGHCVHSGAKGGWYRNVVFVPAYNDRGLSPSRTGGAADSQVAPYGVWWADWAQTSNQWISTGAGTAGSGSPYDFAVLHVQPEDGGGKSLEETVGAALPVWFNAPSPNTFSSLGAWGYPAAAPYGGQQMADCIDRPGRLSLGAGLPAEYRIGCAMSGGSAGGGWFAKEPGGKVALISDTSIGPQDDTWLAGPHLGSAAEQVFDTVSTRFAGQ